MRSAVPNLARRVANARAKLAAISLLCLTISWSAVAAVFNVAAGDAAGLIAAITTANGNGVPNVINLAGGAYNLTVVDNTSVIAGPNGLPAIIGTLTINGNGATIARTGVPLFRVLQVGSATGTAGALTLDNVIITGGNPGQAGIGTAVDGGGILVFAANSALTINGSTITSNTSRVGGGISIDGNPSSAVLMNSTVSSNNATGTTAGGSGGGIAVEGFASSLTVTNSNILNNVAGTGTVSVGSDGGAISVDGGANVITITDSTISGNQANGGVAGAVGGAIAETGGNNSIYVITRSTISNNSANATVGFVRGGAFVALAPATVTIRNSTISGNSLSTPNATAEGGAIANTGGALFVLSNATVTNNSAKTAGGLIQTGAGSITLRNSILAGNIASIAAPDCSGAIASQGHNLVGSTAGCTFAAGTGDLLGQAANLGPLANNGGPTQTHALNAGSVAVDAGDPGVPGTGGTACEATDQRGTLRPMGPRCDIGAFEVVNAAPTSPPTIAKSFGAAIIALNGSTSLSFTITNPNASALTGVGFTDTLPAGLVVATPNGLIGSCGGGAITAVAGSSSISLTGATLAASASCTFGVNVIGTTAGTKNNTSGAVTSVEGGAGNTASASLTVAAAIAPPTIAKSFGAAIIALNGSTSLSFTITNPNASALTGVGFTDALPAGLLVATPNGLIGSCGGGAITAVAGSSSISLTGATLAASASCTFGVNVIGTTAGTKNNTSGAVTSVEGGAGNTASASVTVAAAIAPPAIAKSFGAAIIALNGSTSLSFTITNPNASALTGVGFTDALPAGLVVATPNGLVGSCGGGAITAVAGSSSISLTGGTLAASGSCTFSVNVTGTTAGTKTNTSGAVTSAEGGAGNTASASVTVDTAPPPPATIPTLQQWALWLLGLLILIATGVMLQSRKRV